jgi:putative transport protein
VFDLLAASPLLTIMLVVSLGTLLGAIPFGPVRFGAAGALFVGLALGAMDARLGTGLGLVQTLGLALFVYTVGIAVGARFFRELPGNCR